MSATQPTPAAQPTPTDTTAQLPVVGPRVDVLTNATTVRVRADLPGVAAEALELSLEGRTLHLDGVSARHRFRRDLALDWPIDATADITAQLSDGVLTVDLLRSDAPKPARRIAVA